MSKGFDSIRQRVEELVRSGTFVDVSEFIRNPVRGGVQRVTANLLRLWPAGDAVPIVVRFDGTIALLDPAIVEMMATYFAQGFPGDHANGVRQTLQVAKIHFRRFEEAPLAVMAPSHFLGMKPRIINTELFFDDARLRFYEQALKVTPDTLYLYNHDFIPFLNPEIDPGIDFAHNRNLMRYVYLTRKASNIAFNSQATRQVYQSRILRTKHSTAQVFYPGSDSFGGRAQSPLPNDKHFVVLGAVEQRKLSLEVLKALLSLRAAGHDLRATFVGKIVRLTAEQEAWFRRETSAGNGIEWVDNIDDREMRRLIESARACVFISPLEGYGIPPLESLALGVPVIVSNGLPSLETCVSMGQIRLRDPREEVESAIRTFLDDSNASRLRREAASLRLPTWSDFSRLVFEWIWSNRLPERVERGSIVAGIAELRLPQAVSYGVNSMREVGIEDAIDRFYRRCLRRMPRGGEFDEWYKFGRSLSASSQSLSLAMIAFHKAELEEQGGRFPNLLATAADASGHFPSWLSIGVPYSSVLRIAKMLTCIADAVQLDDEGFAFALSWLSISDRTSRASSSESFYSVRNQPRSKTLGQFFTSESFEQLNEDRVVADFAVGFGSNLAELASILEMDPITGISELCTFLLKRDPGPEELSRYRKVVLSEGNATTVVGLILAKDGSHLTHDARIAYLTLAKAYASKSRRLWAGVRDATIALGLPLHDSKRTLAWIAGDVHQDWPDGTSEPKSQDWDSQLIRAEKEFLSRSRATFEWNDSDVSLARQAISSLVGLRLSRRSKDRGLLLRALRPLIDAARREGPLALTEDIEADAIEIASLAVYEDSPVNTLAIRVLEDLMSSDERDLVVLNNILNCLRLAQAATRDVSEIIEAAFVQCKSTLQEMDHAEKLSQVEKLWDLWISFRDVGRLVGIAERSPTRELSWLSMVVVLLVGLEQATPAAFVDCLHRLLLGIRPTERAGTMFIEQCQSLDGRRAHVWDVLESPAFRKTPRAPSIFALVSRLLQINATLASVAMQSGQPALGEVSFGKR